MDYTVVIIFSVCWLSLPFFIHYKINERIKKELQEIMKEDTLVHQRQAVRCNLTIKSRFNASWRWTKADVFFFKNKLVFSTYSKHFFGKKIYLSMWVIFKNEWFLHRGVSSHKTILFLTKENIKYINNQIVIKYQTDNFFKLRTEIVLRDVSPNEWMMLNSFEFITTEEIINTFSKV